MKLEYDLRLTPQENASLIYDKGKKVKGKAERAISAIEELKRKLSKEERKEELRKKEEEKNVRVKETRKKEWFEKFHYFYSTNNFLVIAGRDAKQNDTVVSKHLEEKDLFFHADIQGAPATILKNAGEASEQDRKEAAQFAAIYSSAWKRGLHNIDVYSAKSSQLSKSSQGEYVGKGGFMVHGQRDWYRNCELKLIVGRKEGKVTIAPSLFAGKLEEKIEIIPGENEKKEIAKALMKKFGGKEEEWMQLLPGNADFA